MVFSLFADFALGCAHPQLGWAAIPDGIPDTERDRRLLWRAQEIGFDENETDEQLLFWLKVSGFLQSPRMEKANGRA